jgi:hypothetical protein
MPASSAAHLTAKTRSKQISVGGAAIEGLKEGRGLENVNWLRYLGLNKLPLDSWFCQVLARLLVFQKITLLMLILICQGVCLLEF